MTARRSFRTHAWARSNNKVINPLKFRVRLPPQLHWYPDMSIENLKSVKKIPFDRAHLPPRPLKAFEQEKFTIKEILDHEKRNGKTSYKTKWMRYPEATWESGDTPKQDVPQLIRNFDIARASRRRSHNKT